MLSPKRLNYRINDKRAWMKSEQAKGNMWKIRDDGKTHNKEFETQTAWNAYSRPLFSADDFDPKASHTSL